MMDSRNNTNIQDSEVTNSQLSLASATFRIEPHAENTGIQNYWNVVNSRYMFYTSKKITFHKRCAQLYNSSRVIYNIRSSSLSFKPKDDYKTATVRELDCYMNTLLDRCIQQKLVNCAINSESASAALSNSLFSNKSTKQRTRPAVNLKRDDRLAELMKRKLLHYEMNGREDQIFIESLEECDKWHELEEEFRERANEAMINFDDNSQNDSKLRQAIKKDNIRIQKLEEINKALLMGVNVNYFEDEESKRIMFKEST